MASYNSRTLKIDTREFERAIHQLQGATGKTLADVVNKKLYYVARRAVWYTLTASFVKIAKEMGQNFQSAKGKRAGSRS